MDAKLVKKCILAHPNPYPMSAAVENLLHLRIELIIKRSRHHEELFLVDTKKAAEDIIFLLKEEGFILDKTAEIKEISVAEVKAA